MSEIDRIRKMAADGTITQQEAAELIAVLDDIDRTESDIDATGMAADAASSGGSPPDMSRASTDVTSKPAADRAAARWTSPRDVTWLAIEMLAGDIEVDVDDSLSEPSFEGPEGVRLEPTDGGFVLRFEKGRKFLEGLLNNVQRDPVRVRVPKGFGVDLRVKAGDVDIRDVPYLRGKILAGDVSARGVRAIDLTMSAGDLDIALAASEGESRIAMTVGDVHVKLDPSSDVVVEGRISIGDASVPAGFEITSKGIGKSYRGTLGQGRAKLEIVQSTGDSKVSVAS